MYESPQMRRLRNDLLDMERLAEESSILRFRAFGKPAQRYLVEFHGRSLARVDGGKVAPRDHHEVEIKLGSAYPRTMPELRWLTPIYHPNISEIGLVCLGGYGTHWVPSLHLDDLCVMLWDMTRYHNYDIRSPYNRDAALWAAHQATFSFPTDSRPLRDLRVARGRIESEVGTKKSTEAVPVAPAAPAPPPIPTAPRPPFVEGESFVILDMEVDLRRPSPPPPPAPPPPPEPDVIFLD